MIFLLFLSFLEFIEGYKTVNRYVIYSQSYNMVKNDSNEPNKEKNRSISFSNLIQLIAMGAGAPGLGEFDKVDPETGKLLFKLEANNFIDNKVNYSLYFTLLYFTSFVREKAFKLKPSILMKDMLRVEMMFLPRSSGKIY